MTGTLLNLKIQKALKNRSNSSYKNKEGKNMSFDNHKSPIKDDKISMSIEDAIKASMRMAPEIIYIGEMRENPEEVKSNIRNKRSFKF